MSEIVYVPPTSHHLDRRAESLAEEGRGDPDSLLTTAAVAEKLGLVLKAGAWYLVAGAPEPRTYRVSSITALTPANKTFRRPKRFDLVKFWAESTRRFEAEIVVGRGHEQWSGRPITHLDGWIGATALLTPGTLAASALSPSLRTARALLPGVGTRRFCSGIRRLTGMRALYRAESQRLSVVGCHS